MGGAVGLAPVARTSPGRGPVAEASGARAEGVGEGLAGRDVVLTSGFGRSRGNPRPTCTPRPRLRPGGHGRRLAAATPAAAVLGQAEDAGNRGGRRRSRPCTGGAEASADQPLCMQGLEAGGAAAPCSILGDHRKQRTERTLRTAHRRPARQSSLARQPTAVERSGANLGRSATAERGGPAHVAYRTRLSLTAGASGGGAARLAGRRQGLADPLRQLAR